MVSVAVYVVCYEKDATLGIANTLLGDVLITRYLM